MHFIFKKSNRRTCSVLSSPLVGSQGPGRRLGNLNSTGRGDVGTWSLGRRYGEQEDWKRHVAWLREQHHECGPPSSGGLGPQGLAGETSLLRASREPSLTLGELGTWERGPLRTGTDRPGSPSSREQQTHRESSFLPRSCLDRAWLGFIKEGKARILGTQRQVLSSGRQKPQSQGALSAFSPLLSSACTWRPHPPARRALASLSLGCTFVCVLYSFCFSETRILLSDLSSSTGSSAKSQADAGLTPRHVAMSRNGDCGSNAPSGKAESGGLGWAPPGRSLWGRELSPAQILLLHQVDRVGIGALLVLEAAVLGTVGQRTAPWGQAEDLRLG